MRIVILAPNGYSETACAMAARLAQSGYVPVGAIALPTFDRRTLRRKLSQWGPHVVANYARGKIIRRSGSQQQVSNPQLEPFLKNGSKVFRSLREVGAVYNFPVRICPDQNSHSAIALLKDWSPDLILFAGGNILRKPLLDLPCLGVLNVHLGFLPEVRGMSTPEWSLLQQVPLGITIHYMDQGIDTGPVLQRFELPAADRRKSVADLRNRLVALGVEKAAEVVSALDRGTIVPMAQAEREKDHQYFVMHDWLRDRAAECLTRSRSAVSAGTMNG